MLPCMQCTGLKSIIIGCASIQVPMQSLTLKMEAYHSSIMPFQHLSEVYDAKALFSSLSAINERLAQCRGDTHNDVLLDLKSLNAVHLRKDLGWALGGGGKEGRPSVKERLDSLVRVDGGMVW